MRILHRLSWGLHAVTRIVTFAGAALAPFAISAAAPPQTPLPPPLYSFDLTSPAIIQGCIYNLSVDVNANDVLALNGPCPLPVITGAALGLGAATDELDGLSSANLLISTNAQFVLLFSVSRDTQGVTPPDPGLIALGVPYNVVDQAAQGQAAGDEFMSTFWFTRAGASGGAPSPNNTLVRNNYDEGGTDHAARPQSSAKSNPVGGPEDNVDALADASGGGGTYYSASAASPSLATLSSPEPASGANIFLHSVTNTIYASADELGLDTNDDIDAMIVFDRDIIGVFDGDDQVLFSLAPLSPSLLTIAGASLNGAAADVFLAAPSQAPSLFASAAELGLGVDLDDLDALDVFPCANPLGCASSRAIRAVAGDFDDDGDVDADDRNEFEDCYGGEGQAYPPGCEPGDFDSDGDVDCIDWVAFVNAWTAEGSPENLPQCSAFIPTVSAWGVAVATLLLLTAGTIVILRRQAEFV